MEEKRKDLAGERQKRLLGKLVEDLSGEEPELYYQPTSSIAQLLHERIRTGGRLSKEERELLTELSERDIEVLLSLR